uniref:E74 like ETS transcription factor 2 n=1 Tax=Sus scrofa TaxID=9823 RepID=A0A8D1HKV6_PIG
IAPRAGLCVAAVASAVGGSVERRGRGALRGAARRCFVFSPSEAARAAGRPRLPPDAWPTAAGTSPRPCWERKRSGGLPRRRGEQESEKVSEYPAVIVEPVPSARLEQGYAAQVLVYDDETYMMQDVAEEQEVETENVETGRRLIKCSLFITFSFCKYQHYYCRMIHTLKNLFLMLFSLAWKPVKDLLFKRFIYIQNSILKFFKV